MIHARGMILHRVAGTASVYMSFWSLVTDYFLVDEFCTITGHVCFMSNKRSKSFDKTVASPPHMDSSIIFTRLCQCAPYLRHASLGPTRVHTPHGISINSAVFAQLTAESPVLYKGPPLPLQNCSFARGIWTPYNTWLLGPNQVHNPDRSSISSAVFAGLTIVTDQIVQVTTTDHTTTGSVTLAPGVLQNGLLLLWSPYVIGQTLSLIHI